MPHTDHLISRYLVADAGVGSPDGWLFKALLAIADRGSRGASDSELNALLQPPGGLSNTRARRNTLSSRNLVVDSGMRRPTIETGTQSIVWILDESVRPQLTPTFNQLDCDLASKVDAGTALSTVERDAKGRLQARMALLARRAVRSCADAGLLMTAEIADEGIGFAGHPTGQDVGRVGISVTLHADGLLLDLVLGQADDSGSDGKTMDRRRQLRSALTSLDQDNLRPLAALVDDGWSPELAAAADDHGTTLEFQKWLSQVGEQEVWLGRLRRRISEDELQDVVGMIDRVSAVAQAAMQIAATTDAVHAADPVQALMSTLFWPEGRAQDVVALTRRAKQLLFSGPPGTGKTLAARVLASSFGDSENVRLVQFHPSYAYEDFVEGIRPVVVSVSDPDPEAVTDAGTAHRVSKPYLSYEIRPGVFKKLVDLAKRPESSDETFFLIIDEINRANLARVLGELLFLLEYRGSDNQVELPYSGEQFFVPDNVWVIGTMNTADRSIALMDAAMRRRFKELRFGVDLDALLQWHQKHTSPELGQEAVQRLSQLNQQVVELLDDDRAIGHSFLMRNDLATVGFDTVWNEDIEPVLRDHLLGRTDDLPSLRTAFLG